MAGWTAVLPESASRRVSIELKFTAAFERGAKQFKIDVFALARRRWQSGYLRQRALCVKLHSLTSQSQVFHLLTFVASTMSNCIKNRLDAIHGYN